MNFLPRRFLFIFFRATIFGAAPRIPAGAGSGQTQTGETEHLYQGEFKH